MRLILLLGFLCICSFAAFSQTKPFYAEPTDDVSLQADQVTRTADLIVAMKGNVRVTMKGVTVYADEAEYNYVTGELTPSGHVRIKVKDSQSAKEQPVDPKENPTDTPLLMPNVK
jgi:lipopolysaccharide assembly outer membrane protein LptD (OstA)